MKTYSPDDERRYYSRQVTDAGAVDYSYLDRYVKGSLGLEFFTDKTVLDLGCGEGVYSAWIADRGRAREVLGVDLTEHRIRRDYELKLPNLKFVAANVLEYDFRGKNFDIVFMNLVLHHLRFALPEISRIVFQVLRPGGLFSCFEPNPYSPVGVLSHYLTERSRNEGLLMARTVRSHLKITGFNNIQYGYFWGDRTWARNAALASSYWVTATKPK